ncbi:proton-coupled folate transporter isoform X1 [Frankliniella occidentalis]|uniref:Proton-coupled folate transporter isoform X1 n=1 Tax=Frankliniella occidentalis TaxID=133901 RepID=A0A6J1SU19_FRAOC|nr:proton-coupled folate transporter isoform X1 [Frankliniella occidentalis]
MSLQEAEPLGRQDQPWAGPPRTDAPTPDDDSGVAKENRRHGGCWLVRGLRSVSVEPVLFAYMFAFMFTSVVEQSFYVDRACRVHLNYSDHICSHIQDPTFKEEQNRVQVEVSSFHQYNGIVSNVVPFLLAPFLGSWSDRRGRKIPLLMGLAGQTYYFAMFTLVTMQPTWRLEMVLGLASFPAALTGTNLAIFAAAFSYMADITSTADRTLRIAILDGTYLASMPTGIALGSFVFSSVVNKSYTWMFAISTCILACALLYSCVRLKWRTADSQRSLKGVNICSDFFDWKHVTESIRAVIRPRVNHGRLYLVLIILSMGLYTFQRNERQMSYLYTQKKFGWTQSEYSNFRTFQTAFYVVVTFLGAPSLTKLCGLKDSVIVLMGAPAHAIARVVFAVAEVPWIFYLGAAVSSLGPTVAPVLRSMTSKVVSIEERGKIFAILTVADSAVPLVSTVIYSQVYNATVEVYPAAIYWVTVASMALVFIFILFVHLSMKRTLSSDIQTLHTEEK